MTSFIIAFGIFGHVAGILVAASIRENGFVRSLDEVIAVVAMFGIIWFYVETLMLILGVPA